jgi:molybdopterin-guanine dinucleotide biosynthesis protein A
MASAAILAGGRAARFHGRDKSALVVAGRPILARQMAALSAIADEVLIVGDRDPAADRALIEPGSTVPIRYVPDRVSGCGPLGGLDAALAAARFAPLVLIAGDMPFITTGLIAYLLEVVGDADAVVPRTERGYHPLCAAYAGTCGPAVRERLASRRLAMVDLLSDIRVRDVTVRELEPLGGARLLANVNTEADYRDIERRFGHEA